MVGCELEEVAGVCQAVDFIKDDSAALVGFQKCFCILSISAGGRKFAIKVGNIWNRPREGGLSNPTRCCQPNHRALPPGFFNKVDPELTRNHEMSFSV
jgi:hypothetical protein